MICGGSVKNREINVKPEYIGARVVHDINLNESESNNLNLSQNLSS